ncbi:hypothetical protein ABFX02_05G025700 [Erythranthe guttata]
MEANNNFSRETELEKKITEHIRNEKDLRLKIGSIEKLALCMEEEAEVASGRFLESDNTSEILMSISKEMAGKLQIAHVNLVASNNREEQANSKLRDFENWLNEKEALISKLLNDNAEVTDLRENVRMLEEKAANLTELNIELTEELDFVKGNNDSNTKKASLLEKQLREFDVQLQHSRALSEASQEQQNMLYSAIWDMETLIDELKQKVGKAENVAENAEEKCVVLSEKNSEMSSRMESMEESLEKASLERKSCVNEISIRTSVIMEMVTELAIERERIEKQLISLTKENKLLRGKLANKKNNASVVLTDNRINVKEVFLDSESAKSGISSESLTKLTEDDSIDEINEAGFPSSVNHIVEAEKFEEKRNYRIIYIIMAILVVVISCLAAHLFQKEKKKLDILKAIQS